MRRLVLIRHAKTEDNHPGGDSQRELLPAGVQDAQEAGALLRPFNLDRALVSSAVRARQTFDALGLNIPAEYLDDLYTERVDVMLDYISETDSSVNGLLVLGHAPNIPVLAAYLTSVSRTQRTVRFRDISPLSFRELLFDVDWPSFSPSRLSALRLEHAIHH